VGYSVVTFVVTVSTNVSEIDVSWFNTMNVILLDSVGNSLWYIAC